MSNVDRKRRQQQVSARSATATAQRAASADSMPSKRVMGWLYGVGLTLAVLGAACLAWLYVAGSQGLSYEGLGGVPAFESATSTMATPAIIWLFAMSALFIAELMRRAAWSVRARSLVRGGSVGVVITPTRTAVAVLWLLLPVLAWVVLVPVPVRGFLDGGAFAGATDDFWVVCWLYGIIAGGIVGVMLVSLLKRFTYVRRARRLGPAPERGREFWRIALNQWRAESMLAFLGFGIAGSTPLLLQDAVAKQQPLDETALVVMLVVSAGFVLVAVLLTLGAWRSGEPYGAAESVA